MTQLSLFAAALLAPSDAAALPGIVEKLQADEDAGLLGGDEFEPDFAEEL